MTSRNARRIAAALTIAATAALGTLASQASAQAAPTNLTYALPNVGAFFALNGGESTAYTTVSFSSGYLGDFDTNGLTYGASSDVTSDVVVTTSGLPAGLTVSLANASILWNAEGQNLAVTLEVDGTPAPGNSYDGTVTLTNTISKQQVTIPIRVNSNG